MAIQDIFNAVLHFEEDTVADLVKAELKAGLSVDVVLNEGLIHAMDEVGRLFGEGELFVPEMLMAAQTMKNGLEVVKPLLGASVSRSKGTVVIGTVKGDLHDIGKNLVAAMLEGGGFEVVDLGVDVTPERFVTSAASDQVGVIALSALLTTTMTTMKQVVAGLEKAGLRDRVKVMVGGAPVTQRYADEIGADGFADSAASAVPLARRLVGAA